MKTLTRGKHIFHAHKDVVLGILVLGLLLIIMSTAFSAVTLGTPSWKSMTTINGYYLPYVCSGGEDGTCSYGACTAVTIREGDQTLFQGASQQLAYGTPVYSDAACSAQVTIPWYNKTVYCSSGSVMVGVRQWQGGPKVDDEYVNAHCASVTGATVGSGKTQVSASNANSLLQGGYKEAVCASGQVMTGVNMYGIYQDVDEEHVDAYCSTFSEGLSAASHWVEAANAWSTASSIYKTATCPAGEVAIGVRFYEKYYNFDEEHTDVLCTPIVQPVTVQVNFS